jgi:hypothetical protein
LIEAKASVTRDTVRMAIGQLADYGRFVPGAARAILLPERPADDLISLLESQRIVAIWPKGNGFDDNGGGRFT